MAIKGSSGRDDGLKVPPSHLKQTPSYTHFQHTTDLLDEDEVPQDVANLSLKSLYRGVAKAVHPDLAADESRTPPQAGVDGAGQ